MHRNVGELLKPEGLLLITSCNWTEEELRQFCDDGDVDDEDNIDEEDDNDEDHDDTDHISQMVQGGTEVEAIVWGFWAVF